MNFKDYYSILDILPQATQKEVEAGYKNIAKKWHPDLNKGFDTTVQMQQISEAYTVLKNVEKRTSYNVEYFRYYQPDIQSHNSKVKIERCHYCGKNIANNEFYYRITFYKETSRSRYPKKVWFQNLKVEIPRCEECRKVHYKGTIFFTLPFFSFAFLGLLLGLTIWSMWFLCLIGGGFVGLVMGSIVSSIDDSINAKEAGIKEGSDYEDFPFVANLIKEGWTTSKPTA